MGSTKLRPWDSAEHLRTEDEMALYLEACLEEDDPALVAYGIGVVARALGFQLHASPRA